MHGAAMAKNVRRTGIPATIKGKPNPDYPLDRHLPKGVGADVKALHPDHIDALERVAASKSVPVAQPKPSEPADGPTLSRIAKAENQYTVGDDKQGTRVYHFHDTTIDRLYSRLARGGEATGSVRAEYVALQKYRLHWHRAGLECSLGSVDLNRVFASDPGSMSGMAKTEGQAHHRKQYRDARDLIGHEAGIVVDNIVCHENSVESAGSAIGYKSQFHGREAATKMLRESARSLAKLWGIS